MDLIERILGTTGTKEEDSNNGNNNNNNDNNATRKAEENEKQQKKYDEEQEEIRNRFNTMIENAKIRFFQEFPPSITQKVDYIIKIANLLLAEDQKTGKYRGTDFYDYMVMAVDVYKKSIENEFKNIRNVRLPQGGKKESRYTAYDYFKDFVETMKKIKSQDQIIEIRDYVKGESTIDTGKRGISGNILGEK